MDLTQPKVAPFSITGRGAFANRGAPRLAAAGFGSVSRYQRGGGKQQGTRSRSRSPPDRRGRRRRDSSESSENSSNMLSGSEGSQYLHSICLGLFSLFHWIGQCSTECGTFTQHSLH